MLFILPVIILVLNAFYTRTSVTWSKKLLWFLACFSMWFVMAMRGRYVGNDTPVYYATFQRISSLSFREILTVYEKDYGFYFLSKLISQLTQSWTVFLCITSYLSLFGIWRFVQENTTKPVLALYFFITIAFYLFLLTGIRQAIAINFCLLSVHYAKERRLLSFLLLVLLGASFHHSCLLFLPTYYVVGREYSWKLFASIMIATFIGLFAYEAVSSTINELLDYSYGIEAVSSGLIFYFVILSIVALALMEKEKWTIGIGTNTVVDLSLIATAVWTFRLFDRVAERPSYYWLAAVPVLLTHDLNYYNRKKRILLLLLAVILCYVLYFRRASSIHYSFFWN